jgi:hypothetical protein
LSITVFLSEIRGETSGQSPPYAFHFASGGQGLPYGLLGQGAVGSVMRVSSDGTTDFLKMLLSTTIGLALVSLHSTA